VTGGAGFIGSNFIHMLLESGKDVEVVNLDKLTYAGNLNNLKDIADYPNYRFIRGDICDKKIVIDAMADVDVVVHFAAESHVDRSIEDSSIFVKTNVEGTNTLLQCALDQDVKKFIHVSTDEVYGSIKKGSFTEKDPLNPSNPYSASKAGSDLLALAYHKTYGLPVIVTRCANNFGPYQHPEKLIPKVITNLMENKKIPVYGNGLNIRDWIYVKDHCRALMYLIKKGENGDIYNISSNNELTNLDIIHKILSLMNKDETMLSFVKDRKGHDFRYSLDNKKIKELGWISKYNYDCALESTIKWYIENK